MVHRIKECLKKNAFIYVPYRMAIDKDFRDYCTDYYNNSRIFRFEHLGDENQGKNVYLIREGNNAVGMFSLVIWTLRRLEVADRFGFVPVVTWAKEVPVNYKNHPNPFLLYFQPVSGISESSIIKSADVAFAKVWDSAYDGRKKSYDFSPDEIERLAKIYAKYLKLKPEIQNNINIDIKKLFGETSGTRVLGVHVRGVEWRKARVQDHPMPIAIEDYLEAAKKMLDELKLDKLFLATDSEETADYFKKNIGDVFIGYQSIRTPAGSAKLSIFNSDNDAFKMGYEVLRDAVALSFCNALLCGLSYVSYGVRIIKQSRSDSFEKVVELDGGRADKGMALEDVENWQRNVN